MSLLEIFQKAFPDYQITVKQVLVDSEPYYQISYVGKCKGSVMVPINMQNVLSVVTNAMNRE